LSIRNAGAAGKELPFRVLGVANSDPGLADDCKRHGKFVDIARSKCSGLSVSKRGDSGDPGDFERRRAANLWNFAGRRAEVDELCRFNG